MLDYREEYYKKAKMFLLNDFEPDDVNKILNTILVSLEGYELTRECSDLATLDKSSEHLIKMYTNSLLIEGKSRNTIKQYNDILLRFMTDTNKQLIDANVSDFRLWLAKMQTKVSLATCENYRSYINAFYTWLAFEEIIQKNPMAKIKPIRIDSEFEPPFTTVELDMIRCACKNTRERAVVEMLLATGARVTELSNMNISDIDFRKMEASIHNGKGGKHRITYMNDLSAVYLKKYLNERGDEEDSLFVNRYCDRLSKHAIEDDMRKLGERAGVCSCHPHRFRVTLASDMHRKGIDIHTIQIILGHSDVNTTIRYIRADSEQAKIKYNAVMK